MAKSDFLLQVGNNIRLERRNRRLTKKQLAAVLDCSEQTIDSIERGVRGTSLENYKRIADFFGLSMDELIGGRGCGRRNITLSDPEYEDKAPREELAFLCDALNDKQVAFAVNFLRELLKYSTNESAFDF